MKLYILRHALAVNRDRWRLHDGKRPLTPKGDVTARLVAKGLKHLGLSFDQILSSPFIRARDTAQITASVLKHKDPVELIPSLSTEGDPKDFIEFLSRLKPKAKVLVVGHEPYLSRLISLLLQTKGTLPLDLKKSGLCRIDVEGDSGTLKWFLPPKLLKKL